MLPLAPNYGSEVTIHMQRRSFLLAGSAAVLAAQSSKKIRVAIIGTGHRAWAHIAVLNAIPDIEIVALVDPTPEFRDRAATLVGGKPAVYSDYRKMLAERKDLDAAVVVTPNFLHAEVTVAALEHGLHVICEKPMATSVDDANRMIAAARKAGKILQIGQQNRYNPIYEKMAALIGQGEIGKVECVAGSLYRGDWNPKSWKYTDPKTGIATNWRFLSHTAGSSLMEDGIHEIDVLNWMIGSRVARIYAMGGNNVLKQRETIDHAGILIEYESGVKFSFNFSLFGQNSGQAGRQMVLVGNEGVMQQLGDQISIRKSTGPRTEKLIDVEDKAPAGITAKVVGPDQDSRTYRQHVAFVESIRTGKPPRCSGEVGKEAMKISLLAEKSVRERRIVNWNDLPA